MQMLDEGIVLFYIKSRMTPIGKQLLQFLPGALTSSLSPVM
jgi:hypothetical protein